MTERNANRPGYKKTKVGWIPEEWEVKTLKHIGQIHTGGTPSTTKPDYWDGDINWIIPSEVTQIEGSFLYSSERKITEKGLRNSSAKVVPENSVIVCTRATIGNCVINKIPTATNQGFKSLSPYKIHDVKFIYYSIVKNKKNLLRLGAGSTFLEVSRKDFERIRLAIPPLLEQKKIAKILSAWDRAIEQTQQLIDAKRRLKKGLMQQLLTGRMRFPGFGPAVEKPGELPEGWEVKKISEIAEVIVSNVDKKIKNTEIPVRLCNYMDVFPNHYITSNMKFMEATATKVEIKKFSLRKYDVLITKDSETAEDIASSAIIMEEIDDFVCGYHLAILRPKEENSNGLFISYVLYLDKVHNDFVSRTNGVTRFGLTIPSIKHVNISMPCKAEQTKISSALYEIDLQINFLVKNVKLLKRQKKGLLQTLLTGETSTIKGGINA